MTRTAIEQQLKDGLTSLAGDGACEGGLFGPVFRRRRAMLRRRAAVSCVGFVAAAGALGILTPLPLPIIAQDSPSSRLLGGAATMPTVPASSDRQTPASPVAGLLRAQSLAPGAAPGVPYVSGVTLHDAGRAVPLPIPDALHVDDVVRLGSGWLVATRAREQGDPEAVTLFVPMDEAVRPLSTYGLRSLVVNATHTRAAWLDHQGFLTSADSVGHVTRAKARASTRDASLPLAIAGFTSSDLVSLEDGSVWNIAENVLKAVRTSGRGVGSAQGAILTSAGPIALTGSDSSSASAGAGERPCVSSIDAVNGDFLWRSCAWAVSSYSPDGRHALALPLESAGSAHARRISILDASTGKVQSLFTGQFDNKTLVWENDEHFLTLSAQDGESADHASYTVVRCDLDGRCERADPESGPLTWNDVVGKG